MFEGKELIKKQEKTHTLMGLELLIIVSMIEMTE